ncbi:MAG: DUF4105 domain-containing protein [Idiomarina sp.]|nr:DUF4105 domain-containing protein [Idiomarina sp.]
MKAFFVVALCAAALSWAYPAAAVQQLPSDATLANIAAQPTWLKLLHFDREGLFSEPRSAVNDANFFFAEDGAVNPKAELEATLRAMLAPEDDVLHPSCNFPARAMWLSEQGLIQLADDISCPAWDEWRHRHDNGKVGLTFASGYLGNPASFFGHLLLHIRPPADGSADQMTASHLLDSSLNFGADIPATDGMLPYMVKGLIGGYQARYSEAPFYRNTSLYSETQMRDSWFYQLDLPAAKQAFLIAHLYEVLGHNFDYLFLSQNCASRIGRTLELVIDDSLAKSAAPWVSPEQVIRLAAPHTSDTVYYPSRRRITEHAYHELSPDEQHAIGAAWPTLSEFSLSAPALQALPERSQARVLDVLLSHALFIQQSAHKETGQEIQHKLLQARLQLPAQAAAEPPLPAPRPPHEAAPTASVRIGAGYSDRFGEGMQISFRPLQYDLLESNDDRMPFAALEILRLDLDIFDSRPELSQLVLFDVTNLNTLNTGLPIESKLAWQAKAQIQSQQLACQGCQTGSLHLNGGQSWRAHNLTLYGLVGGVLRTTGYQQGPAALELQAGALYDWSPGNRTWLRGEYQNGGQGANSEHWRMLLEHRVQVSRYRDIRLKVVKDSSDTQVSLNLGLYW